MSNLMFKCTLEEGLENQLNGLIICSHPLIHIVSHYADKFPHWQCSFVKSISFWSILVYNNYVRGLFTKQSMYVLKLSNNAIGGCALAPYWISCWYCHICINEGIIGSVRTSRCSRKKVQNGWSFGSRVVGAILKLISAIVDSYTSPEVLEYRAGMGVRW